jgi:hypothetical protein
MIGSRRRLREALGTVAMCGLVALGLWLLPSGWRPAVVVTALLIVAVACLVRLPAWLIAHDTTPIDALSPEQRASAVSGARTTLVQGLVGLLALTGVFVAWQQLQTDRGRSRIERQQLQDQLAVTRQGQIADRFTRSIDQLGSSKLELRLGGIYGLERIAKERPDDGIRLVVVELLTTFVRQHTGRTARTAPDAAVSAGQDVPAPDVQAALTVLGRRTVAATDPPLDLHGMVLHGADLRRARLRGADLTGVQLQGAHLEAAELQGAVLYLANLRGALLDGARLQWASLVQAQLSGASLDHAQLQGSDLSGADLQTAILFGAQLQGARLQQTRLRGATVDDRTAWPQGFNRKAAGAVYP